MYGLQELDDKDNLKLCSFLTVWMAFSMGRGRSSPIVRQTTTMSGLVEDNEIDHERDEVFRETSKRDFEASRRVYQRTSLAYDRSIMP